MTYLLDANALAALVIPQHEHHSRAHRFFARRPFAITPLTQLALLQILSRPRRVQDQLLPALHAPAEALRLVRVLSNRRGVQFLPADMNCAGRMPFAAITGHRQWNDFTSWPLLRKQDTPRHFRFCVAYSVPRALQIDPLNQPWTGYRLVAYCRLHRPCP